MADTQTALQDRTGGNQGQNPPGDVQTSSDSGQATSYSQEQVDALIDKAKSDALAAAGRDAKTLDNERAKLDQERAANEKRQQELDALEEQRVKDNPDALQDIQRRREHDRQMAELRRQTEALESRSQELDERERLLGGTQAQQVASRIATEFNVDVNDLISFTDGSEEKMRALAAKLPKSAATTQTTQTTIIPDSGLGGSSPTRSMEQLRQVDTRGFTLNQLAAHKQEIEAAERAAK